MILNRYNKIVDGFMKATMQRSNASEIKDWKTKYERRRNRL